MLVKGDWTGVKRVAKYLKRTAHFTLSLSPINSPKLIAYTDANWAEDCSGQTSTNIYYSMEGDV